MHKVMSKILETAGQCLKEEAESGTLMNHHSIHTLIVLNPDNTICGVIDSFSCLPGTRSYH